MEKIKTQRKDWFIAFSMALFFLLHSLGIPGSAEETKPSKRLQGAQSALEQYFRLEDKEDYERCYDLLSSGYKEGLKTSYGITSRRDYRRFREFQGVRFLNPEIEADQLGGVKLGMFTVKAKYVLRIFGKRIEDKIELSAVLVEENGKWPLHNLIAGMED